MKPRMKHVTIVPRSALFSFFLDISVLCNSPPSVPSLACKTVASSFKLTIHDLSHSLTFTQEDLSTSSPIISTSPANSFCLALCCLRRLAVSTRTLYTAVHGFHTCNAILFIWNISVAVNLDMSIIPCILRILNMQGNLFLSQYTGALQVISSSHDLPSCADHPLLSTIVKPWSRSGAWVKV